MRNKSNYITTTLTILLMLVAPMLFGQQAEKTLVKSFNLEGLQTVSLGINAPVEVIDWDQPFLRVQMHIELETGSEALLKSLVRVGRYNLKGQIAEEIYTIIAPDLNRKVKIVGQPLADRVTFVINKPRHVQFIQPEAPQQHEQETASSL